MIRSLLPAVSPLFGAKYIEFKSSHEAYGVQNPEEILASAIRRGDHGPYTCLKSIGPDAKTPWILYSEAETDEFKHRLEAGGDPNEIKRDIETRNGQPDTIVLNFVIKMETGWSKPMLTTDLSKIEI